MFIINDRKVYVEFSTHVWTNGKGGVFNVFYKNERRFFCYERYMKSLDLPHMIKALDKNDRLMQNEGNWFFIRDGLYHVFMNIQPSRSNRFDYYIIVKTTHNRNSRVSDPARAIKYIIK